LFYFTFQFWDKDSEDPKTANELKFSQETSETGNKNQAIEISEVNKLLCICFYLAANGMQ